MKQWEAITHLYPNFNSVLVKLPLELGMDCVP